MGKFFKKEPEEDLYISIKEKVHKREEIERELYHVKRTLKGLKTEDEYTQIGLNVSYSCNVRTEWLRKRLDEYIKEEYDRSQQIRDEINMINKGD